MIPQSERTRVVHRLAQTAAPIIIGKSAATHMREHWSAAFTLTPTLILKEKP